MGITNLDELYLNGVPVIPGSTSAGLFTGNWYFVNETTGGDGNAGTADAPLATLSAALAKCNANNNDVVAFSGTIHLTSTLVWSKANVSLIGLCASLKRGKRARISVSGSTAFSPMVSVTAAGCTFANFGTFYGFASASNNVTPWQDTGGRNSYNLVEFMGFGDGTVTTGTANKTTSRAFVFNNSTGESTFRSCVFGVDTIQRGAANHTLEIAGGAPRLSFYDCDFEADLASGGTASSHVLIGSAGIDRYCDFINCRFLCSTKSSGSAMAQGFNVSASAGGWVNLDQCFVSGGITAIETTPSNSIQLNMAAPSASAGGKAVNNS